MLLHLPPMPGHGGPRVKNGPPLAGRGAELCATRSQSKSRRCPSSYPAHSHGTRALRCHNTHSSRSQPGFTFISVTLKAPSNEARTRTPTVCSANTPQEARTLPDTPPRTSKPSPPPSTADHARHSAGAHLPKPSTSIYDPYKRKPLRRPLESAQYTSYDYTQLLDDHDVLGSIRTIGDAFDWPPFAGPVGLVPE